MATSRINGIRYQLDKLTQHELDALVRMAEQRIEAAQSDRDKLINEYIRRSNNVIHLFDRT